MGGVCAKQSSSKDASDSPRDALVNRGLLEKPSSRANSLKILEGAVVKNRVDSRDGRIIDKRHGSSQRLNDEKKRREKEEAGSARYGATNSFSKVLHWDTEEPRWPSWLLSVASEAVKGWIPRRADTFERIAKVCPFHFVLYEFFIEICVLNVPCINIAYFKILFLVKYFVVATISLMRKKHNEYSIQIICSKKSNGCCYFLI